MGRVGGLQPLTQCKEDLDSTQTHSKLIVVGLPNSLNPAQAPIRTVCKQIAEPWGCGIEEEELAPRSHFPSLVSYRLAHIHWKSVLQPLHKGLLEKMDSS